nr:hypothetical protein CFP56_64863 [Quercus suber]
MAEGSSTLSARPSSDFLLCSVQSSMPDSALATRSCSMGWWSAMLERCAGLTTSRCRDRGRPRRYLNGASGSSSPVHICIGIHAGAYAIHAPIGKTGVAHTYGLPRQSCRTAQCSGTVCASSLIETSVWSDLHTSNIQTCATHISMMDRMELLLECSCLHFIWEAASRFRICIYEIVSSRREDILRLLLLDSTLLSPIPPKRDFLIVVEAPGVFMICHIFCWYVYLSNDRHTDQGPIGPKNRAPIISAPYDASGKNEWSSHFRVAFQRQHSLYHAGNTEMGTYL